jgi:hypothetical protein
MLNTIDTAGHPRDMGLAQGAAARHEIRAEAARLGLPLRRSTWPTLRALAVGSVRGEGAGREMLRHFAHLSERLEGLARSADLPIDAGLEMHLRVRAGGAQAGLLSRRATMGARAVSDQRERKTWRLERSVPRALADECGWVLRESVPVVGYRSIELTLPWLVTSVAGLNERGLAVVGGPLLWGAPGREGDPTSLLLVQECLQRFSDLEGALDWCLKRPVEGEQSILLTDASGALASVIVNGRERRVQRGEGELHLDGGEPAPTGRYTDEAEEPDWIWLDPLARRVRVRHGGAEVDAVLAPSEGEEAE